MSALLGLIEGSWIAISMLLTCCLTVMFCSWVPSFSISPSEFFSYTLDTKMYSFAGVSLGTFIESENSPFCTEEDSKPSRSLNDNSAIPSRSWPFDFLAVPSTFISSPGKGTRPSTRKDTSISLVIVKGLEIKDSPEYENVRKHSPVVSGINLGSRVIFRGTACCSSVSNFNGYLYNSTASPVHFRSVVKKELVSAFTFIVA